MQCIFMSYFYAAHACGALSFPPTHPQISLLPTHIEAANAHEKLTLFDREENIFIHIWIYFSSRRSLAQSGSYTRS